MLNKERETVTVTVDEFFVKAPHHDSQGGINPLPPEGEVVLDEFKKSWLSEQLPEGQFPMVSVGPVVLDDGLEGYSIRKEIVYKNRDSIPPPPYIQ